MASILSRPQCVNNRSDDKFTNIIQPLYFISFIIFYIFCQFPSLHLVVFPVQLNIWRYAAQHIIHVQMSLFLSEWYSQPKFSHYVYYLSSNKYLNFIRNRIRITSLQLFEETYSFCDAQQIGGLCRCYNCSNDHQPTKVCFAIRSKT